MFIIKFWAGSLHYLLLIVVLFLVVLVIMEEANAIVTKL